MEANPDNMQGWLMLAFLQDDGPLQKAPRRPTARRKRSSTTIPNCSPAMRRPWPWLPAMASREAKPTGRARPENRPATPALLVTSTSTAPMEAGNNKKGIAYWEALLPQVEPGSEIGRMLGRRHEQDEAGQLAAMSVTPAATASCAVNASPKVEIRPPWALLETDS